MELSRFGDSRTNLPFGEVCLFFISFLQPRGRVINVLALDVLPYDFLLDNETENTKSTLKIEYE